MVRAFTNHLFTTYVNLEAACLLPAEDSLQPPHIYATILKIGYPTRQHVILQPHRGRRWPAYPAGGIRGRACPDSYRDFGTFLHQGKKVQGKR